MAKLSSYRRLFSQDFEPEQKELIEQIGTTINSSFEELYLALNNRLTIRENLSATINEFTIAVDAGGNPKNKTQFKLENGQTNVEGLFVINAFGAKNPADLPIAGVFVSFVKSENFIVIQNVKGLQADISYKIKVIALG